MFKVTFVLGTLLLLNLVNADDDEPTMTMDEVKEQMKPLTDNCVPVPPDADIEQLIQMVENASRGAKCLCLCLMKQCDMFENGAIKLDIDKATELLLMIVSKNEEAKEIIDKCNAERDPKADDCEAAYAFAVCIRKGLIDHGYKPPKIK